MTPDVLRSAWTGEYNPQFDTSSAEAIVAQSFGARAGGEPGIVNERLADFILNLPNHLPVIAQREIAMALEDRGRTPAKVIEGTPSTGVGGQLDSFMVLSEAREWMYHRGLLRPLLVAQAHQIGRFTLQANRLFTEGKAVVPANLPPDFDPESTQLWTRNRELWALREAIRIPVLRLQGKI